MTLFRQLMMTIVVIFSVMLVVVMGINFNTTKGYLIGQLESTTQDSATSLSMSISDFMALEDYAAVESSVNAVFDSGYFSKVRVHVYDTESDIVRANEMNIIGVPSWFIQLIDFEVPEASAVISNGWSELGQVYITGSAGYGYYQLWLASKNLLTWFLCIGAVTLLIGSFALRWLFKPLAEVERQAQQIQQRHFVKMDKIPKTRELKSVVESMNRMADKLEKEFASEVETAQWLQAKAFKDPVSGLGNRNFFDSQMTAHFAERQRSLDGLILVSLADLAKLNNEKGYEAADMFIRSAGEVIAKRVAMLSANVTLARLSGADFVVLIPDFDQDQLQVAVETLMEDLLELNVAKISYCEHVANIGAVTIDGDVDKSGIMAQADTALRAAKTAGPNTVQVYDLKETREFSLGRMAWKDVLNYAIEHKEFSLRKQKVFAFEENRPTLHEEVFSSLVFGGKTYHAGYFIGLAEQFDIGDRIDQVIIDEVIQYLVDHPNQAPLAINLSASAYIKTSFVAWLDSRLGELEQKVKTKLIFEVSEQSVLATEEQAIELVGMLKKHGVMFGIDNVGKQFSAFQYLKSLMPDYVKVDPSYTRMVIGKDSEAFFMHTLCKMFNSLSIKVIATGIESDKQQEALQRFDLSAGQGYVAGRAQDM
ncbi:bifunctional diguanylate cyclase/phosphodiesterase [Marinomonas epiphytica]